MLWVFLDIAIGLLAVAALGFCVFTLYKRVRHLGRVVGETSRVVGEYSAGLQVNQPRR